MSLQTGSVDLRIVLPLAGNRAAGCDRCVRVFCLLLLLGSAVAAAAVEPLPFTRAVFRFGDDQSWSQASFDDSGWSGVRLDAGWNVQKLPGSRFVGRKGWYRLHVVFTEPQIQSNSWLVSTGFIGNASETWLNGTRIGSHGKISPIEVVPQRTVHAALMPAHLLKPGENVIAVRVGNFFGDGGILGGPVGVFRDEAGGFRREMKHLELGREVSRMLVVALCLVWALIFVLLRLLGDDTQPWAHAGVLFAMTGLAHGLGTHFSGSAEWYGIDRAVMPLMIVLFWAAPTLTVSMVGKICRETSRRSFWIVLGSGIVCLGWAGSYMHWPQMSLLAYAVHLMVTGISCLAILVRGLRRGERMAWVMLGSGILYVVAVTAQITLAYFPWLPHAALVWEPMDIGIIIGVMTLGTSLLRRYVRAQRRERELSRQLLHAARDERARVGRHLHDHVVQDMHYLHLQSQNLATADEKQSATLKQLREGLLGAVQEVRRVAEDLQPLATRGASLAEALETLARLLTERFSVPVQVECETPPSLSEATRETLYRVAHEAAMNACRHAAAKRVLIRVHREGGQLKLDVTDNGRGFSPDSLSSERLGLRFLRDHAAFTGGRLQIDSKPGNGTRVIYTLDLPPTAT